MAGNVEKAPKTSPMSTVMIGGIAPAPKEKTIHGSMWKKKSFVVHSEKSSRNDGRGGFQFEAFEGVPFKSFSGVSWSPVMGVSGILAESEGRW